MLKIFCCYAPEDKELMERLSAHLHVLEFQYVGISELQSAHLVLFLVSSDFVSSRELHKRAVLPAMERYKREETCIIPIILRPVLWQETPFGELQPLPEEGKPVTDWKSQDKAFVNVVRGIKRTIKDNEKLHLILQRESDEAPQSGLEGSPRASTDPVTQLERIIQELKILRSQIADAAHLKIPQGFSVEGCEGQYNKLFGDAMIFLATYLPQFVLDDEEGEEGFVETVYNKASAELQQRNNFSVGLARWLIPPLAGLEKLAAQIDASVATLELYNQKYFVI